MTEPTSNDKPDERETEDAANAETQAVAAAPADEPKAVADAPTSALPVTPAVEETAPAGAYFGAPGEWNTPGEDFGGADRGPSTSLAATFLPGLEATAVIALILSVLGAAAYLLVYPLVQTKSGAESWANYKNKVPQTNQDPFITERLTSQYQSWAHIGLGVVAILVALLVLGLWTAGKNKEWARSVAQAALVIGLAVAVYGVLMRTGVIAGGLPSTKTIQQVYTQMGAASGGSQ